MTDTADAVAELTTAWLRALPLDQDTVVSGAGLWPLLALMAGAADGATRDELAGAVGMDPALAAAAAGALLTALDGSPDIACASGTWVRAETALHDWWRAHVPADSIGELTTQAALDRWAREHTNDVIRRMPINLHDEVVVVIATALLLETRWQAAFTESEVAGRTWLRRSTDGVADVRTVGAVDRPVTVVTVRGEHDIDVLLAIGTETAAPGDVLAALLTGQTVASGHELFAGRPPGIRVSTISGRVPKTELALPAFDVRCTHNLLEHGDVFGLRTAASNRAQLPRLSPRPLKVDQAAQEVVARFFATGFEAAAVTAVAFRSLSLSASRPEAQQLEVSFDRPFGFAAVHRPTGAPVVAGWIADLA